MNRTGNLVQSDYPTFLRPGHRIYFVGIGGISMSGLAEIAQSAGYRIAGSDRHLTTRTEYLAEQGIPVYAGHDPLHLEAFKPDLVVYTAAVHADNPELIHARNHHIPIVDRATFLGWLNRTFTQVINISGTHGKTTTTALCALILMASNQNPTVHLGAELAQFKTTVHLGEPGGLMVSEACEYQRSFLRFHSTTAAVLNIDYDHVDSYKNLDEVIEAFVLFAAQLKEDGYLVMPAFDHHVETMVARLQVLAQQEQRKLPRLIWFGSAEDRTPQGKKPDFRYENLIFTDGLPSFDVFFQNRLYGHLDLKIPGLHNVVNALAALACAHFNGSDPVMAVEAANQFHGAEGRFTLTGHYHGAKVIADYAHHPSAARATLAAASHMPHQHIWVVFQPLTFSRTKVLFNEFVDALKDCEQVLFAEIFSDREINPGDISSRQLADRINELGGHAAFFENFAAIQARLDELVHPGDLILILGPEDIRTLADHLTGRTGFMQQMD